VHVFRDVSNLDVRHACIVHASVAVQSTIGPHAPDRRQSPLFDPVRRCCLSRPAPPPGVPPRTPESPNHPYTAAPPPSAGRSPPPPTSGAGVLRSPCRGTRHGPWRRRSTSSDCGRDRVSPNRAPDPRGQKKPSFWGL
jgi:hypothetical protein